MQQGLNTSVLSQQKPVKCQLSKSHLISLFALRKIKSTKIYISELKNSNPKAEKAIKQALLQIFCLKQIPSATAYMYGLVFYKNLLISAQMDYYEDEDFFPLKIHSSIMEICQYNSQQQDIKSRGADYFSYAINLQNKENEDLQATGKGVVVFALQLLQMMGQLYKQSYLTGEESFFAAKYNELITKGITFPKQSQYLYIKQQDRKQFQQNYIKLLQSAQNQDQQLNENKQKINNIQTKHMNLAEKQTQLDRNKVQEPKSVQKQSLIMKAEKEQKAPLSKGISEILKQVQQKRVKEQVHKQNTKGKHSSQQKSTVGTLNQPMRNQKQSKPLLLPNPSQSTANNIIQTPKQQIISNIDQKQTSRNYQSQLNVNATNSKHFKQGIKILSSAQNDKKEISSNIKKSFKRTELPPQKKTQPIITYDNILAIDSSQLHPKSKQTQNINTFRHKHKIFEQIIPKSSQPQSKSKSKLNRLQINQKIQHNLISDSILSFSPKPNSTILDSIRPSPHKSKKKSVPKTQKKCIEQTFSDNFQQLAFKINAQKPSDKNNKKSSLYFPTKTLSTWRCEKTIQRQFDPSFSSTDVLEQIWSMAAYKQLPFVPEYFYPTTLKMSGLRRAALQICDFSSRSEIFFNNNVIAARLMKPSQNYFILSLENVSHNDFMIRVMNKREKLNAQESIKLVDKNDNKNRLLKVGTFMDVRFIFMTNDFNFKFLTIDFEIDDKILTLQLPVTLLDSCIVKENVDVYEVSSFVRKSGRFWDSEPIPLNPLDVPKFITPQNYQSNQKNYNKLSLPTSYFTISLKSNKELGYGERNTLYCRLNDISGNRKRYQLSFLFNSNNENTQDFAKVMMELLMFSLYE